MRAARLALAALLAALIAATPASGEVTGTLTPPAASFTGAPGDCFTEDLIGDVVIPEPPTDLLFLADLTGSGGWHPLNELSGAAFHDGFFERMTSIVPDLRATGAWHQDHPATPVAACDYPGIYGEPTDIPWQSCGPFADDGIELGFRLSGTPGLGGGGDAPESQTWALHRAMLDVPWDPSRRQVIIHFTDELPHACNPGECLGTTLRSSGSDPGADGSVGTPDDLDILDVVDDLAARDIVLVMADLSSGTFDPSRGFGIAHMWNCWAARTGGFSEIAHRSFGWNEPLPDVVERILRKLHERCESLSVGARPGDEAWLDDARPIHPQMLHSGSRGFAVRLCIPPGTPDGTHVVELRLLCGDVPLAAHAVTIDVRACGCTAGRPILGAGRLDRDCFPDPASAEAAAIAATSAGGGCAVAPVMSAATSGSCDATIVVRGVHECGEDAVTYSGIRIDGDGPVLAGVPPDAVVECDAVPAPAIVTAGDGCDGPTDVAFTETRTDGDCPGRFVLVREWSSVDRCGNASVARQLVAVRDTTPPVIDPTVTSAHCLWPPAHRMAQFTRADFLPSIHDACGGPVSWRFADCASSQPDDGLGDGSTSGDCVVSADGSSVSVRSERAGPDARGRTYAVLAEATDACGNTSAAVAVGFVHVPHDGREHPECLRAGR